MIHQNLQISAFAEGRAQGDAEGYARAIETAAQCADRVAVPSERRDAMLGDIGTGMIIAATTIASAIRALLPAPSEGVK